MCRLLRDLHNTGNTNVQINHVAHTRNHLDLILKIIMPHIIEIKKNN